MIPIDQDLRGLSLFTLGGSAGSEEVEVLTETSSDQDWYTYILLDPNIDPRPMEEPKTKLLGKLCSPWGNQDIEYLFSGFSEDSISNGIGSNGAFSFHPVAEVNSETSLAGWDKYLNSLQIEGGYRIIPSSLNFHRHRSPNHRSSNPWYTPFMGGGSKIPSDLKASDFRNLVTVLCNPSTMIAYVVGSIDDVVFRLGPGLINIRSILLNYFGVIQGDTSLPLELVIPYIYLTFETSPTPEQIATGLKYGASQASGVKTRVLHMATQRMVSQMWYIVSMDFGHRSYATKNFIEKNPFWFLTSEVSLNWSNWIHGSCSAIPFRYPLLVILLSKYNTTERRELPLGEEEHFILKPKILGSLRQLSQLLESDSPSSYLFRTVGSLLRSFAIQVFRLTSGIIHFPSASLFPKRKEAHKLLFKKFEAYKANASLQNILGFFSLLWESEVRAAIHRQVNERSFKECLVLLARHKGLKLSKFLQLEELQLPPKLLEADYKITVEIAMRSLVIPVPDLKSEAGDLTLKQELVNMEKKTSECIRISYAENWSNIFRGRDLVRLFDNEQMQFNIGGAPKKPSEYIRSFSSLEVLIGSNYVPLKLVLRYFKLTQDPTLKEILQACVKILRTLRVNALGNPSDSYRSTEYINSRLAQQMGILDLERYLLSYIK
tara:strand:+ start:4608 stop:6587 length:1980 start_codon:yes stop_codon:yes gene_type:complete